MLIDSHAHVDMPAFREDLGALLDRCRDAGVERFVDILSPFEPDGIEALRREAEARSFPLAFTMGVHPHDASRLSSAVEDQVARFVEGEGVGWGEIGLDYHYDHCPREEQRRAFERQLRLARRIGKPVVVHSREADEDTVRILKDAGAHEGGGVIHCFTGSPTLAEGALDLGFSISFSGIVTFKNARAIQEIARAIPEERILVETDSPYLAPRPLRGRRNEPGNVRLVAEFLADLREVPLPLFAQATRRNTMRLFRLSEVDPPCKRSRPPSSTST